MRRSADPCAALSLDRPLYRSWDAAGLSPIRQQVVVLGIILISLSMGGCSVTPKASSFTASGDSAETTGSIGSTAQDSPGPTETDLAFARNAASDVLTRGGKDLSQPWENPQTGARGSVTPLSSAYSEAGRTCRDFLASYVHGRSEAWMQGEACKSTAGQWEIRTLKPWKRS